MLERLTSMWTQLSVLKAIARSAVATMAVMVARDRVTAEQGMMCWDGNTYYTTLTDWGCNTRLHSHGVLTGGLTLTEAASGLPSLRPPLPPTAYLRPAQWWEKKESSKACGQVMWSLHLRRRKHRNTGD